MKFANFYGYSDIQAHEVIRQVSAKCFEVRRMKATLQNGVNSGQPDALQFAPGGFCGHTSGTQRYEYASDETQPVIRIRLHKDGRYHCKNGGKFKLADAPVEHYDFNF